MTGLRKSSEERREELVKAAMAVAMAEGLENVTGRKVAARAGLSSGLVFFHFDGRTALLEAVLDGLLENIFGTFVVPPGADANERMIEFLRQRIERLRAERRQIELFVDFWVMGVREPGIRKRMREGLERYRELLRPVAADVARGREPMTGDGLAQVAVSFVLGLALQVVMDSGRVDAAESLLTVRELLAPTAKAVRA
ncbi:MAG: TetR/AcrR family transcriptional regulator [Myxococcota bacterium]